MDTKEQISKIIERDLPKQVGETLQKRLKRADELEKLYETSSKKVIQLEKRVAEVNEENNVLAYLKSEKEAIKNDRETLTWQQLNFKVEKTLLDQKVTSSNEKTDILNNLVGLLVKNPQAVTSMFTSHSSISHYRNDGQQDFEPTESHTTITKTNEKSE